MKKNNNLGEEESVEEGQHLETSIRLKICETVDEAMTGLLKISEELYLNPETGGEEKNSSALLIGDLTAHDFIIEKNYFDMEYAFRAYYDSQKPGPVIGIFAEYDALPEIGHGCGHNLICTAALGAAYGLKSVINNLGGKIVVYGTPGEENLQAKAVMAPRGAFDEADVTMMVHPYPTTVTGGATLAIESLQVEFFGKSSHAGVSPEQGINALDAAVQCYQMINHQKQYHPDTNVYGIINDGGSKANVIPDYASMKFLTRAWELDEMFNLRKMVEACAEAAAKMTGCTFNLFNNEDSNAPMKQNQVMNQVFDSYLMENGVTEIEHMSTRGSTDMGDVSQLIPSIHPWVGLNCPDLTLHTREFASRTLTPYGEKFVQRGAKSMACTAAEIISDPELLRAIKEEFEAIK